MGKIKQLHDGTENVYPVTTDEAIVVKYKDPEGKEVFGTLKSYVENTVNAGVGSINPDDLLNEALVTTEKIGGIEANTTFAKDTALEDILRQMLVKAYAPEVSISCKPTVAEKGTTQTLTITGTVTKKTYDIADLIAKVTSGSGTVSIIQKPTATGGSYKVTVSDVTVDTTVAVTVTDTGKLSTTKTTKCDFTLKPKWKVFSTTPTLSDIENATEWTEPNALSNVKEAISIDKKFENNGYFVIVTDVDKRPTKFRDGGLTSTDLWTMTDLGEVTIGGQIYNAFLNETFINGESAVVYIEF